MRSYRADLFRVGHRLADGGGAIVDAHAITRDLGVPSSTAGDWIRQLRFHRALVETPGGDRVDRPRLLSYLTSVRVAALSFVREVHVDGDVVAVSERLAEAGVDHAFGMLTAANEWAFTEPLRSLQLYVPRRRARDIADILPEGDVRLDVFAENLDRLVLARRRGLQVTDAFLTLLDCRAHPEGGAHADFLARTVLGWGAGP